MATLCCCRAPRSAKGRLSDPPLPTRARAMLPTPPPPARLPGPLTLNPVIPVPSIDSPRSTSPFHTAVPAVLVPVEPVELGQLVVEDSDSDDELEPAAPSKSTSTLQLVKTRIRRHLSQDSLSKKNGRSAVGNSEQEVARRAELKRLMHKRIQEELRSEEGQESSHSDASSSHRSIGPSREPLLPGGGPRDKLEFSVAKDAESDKFPASLDHVDLPCRPKSVASIHVGDRHLSGRRASCPDCRSLFKKTDCPASSRKQSSLPEMPASPNLLPKRLNSTRETSSLASWRLSYSAGQLDELLDILDPGNSASESKTPTLTTRTFAPSGHTHSLSRSRSSPARHNIPGEDNESLGNQSPLGTWLRSQELRSRSPSLSGHAHQSEQSTTLDENIHQAEILYLRRWSSVRNCAVAETDIARPEIVHLYDMDIHRQLGTRGLNSPEESPRHSVSVRGSIAESLANVPTCSETDPHSPVAYRRPPGGHRANMASISEVPGGLVTCSSSQYPSTASSMNPSPGTSTVHLPHLPDFSNGKSAWALQPSAFQFLGNPFTNHAHHGSGDNTTGARSSMSVPGLEAQTETRGNGQVFSESFASHTPGVEPPVTKGKYAGESNLRNASPVASPPVVISKPDSDTEDISSAPSTATKTSILARLHLAKPKRAKLSPKGMDGPGVEVAPRHLPLFMTLSVAGVKCGLHSKSSNVSEGSMPAAIATGAIGRNNIPAESSQPVEEGPGLPRTRGSAILHRRLSLPHDGLATRERELPVPKLRHYESVISDRNRKAKAGDRPQDSRVSPLSFPVLLGESDSPMRRSFSPAKSQTPTSPDDRSTAPLHTPTSREGFGSLTKHRELAGSPGRFALYGRTEKPGPMARSHRVEPKDFALQQVHHVRASQPQLSDMVSASALPDHDKEAQTLSEKIGKAVRSGLSKLMLSRASSGNNSPTSPKDCRKCTGQGDREREPEVELMSMEEEYRQTEINSLGGQMELQYPPATRDKISNPGEQGLGMTKVASLSQIHGGSGKRTYLAGPVGAARLTGKDPVTPASSGRHGKEKDSTTTTERFVTPLSGSMTASNDNLSFHSYPMASRSESGALATPIPATPADRQLSAGDGNDDVKSARSAVETVISLPRSTRGLRPSATVANLNALSSADAGPAKFQTWGGRSKTQSFLLRSTLEFGDALGDMVWKASLGNVFPASQDKAQVEGLGRAGFRVEGVADQHALQKME